MTGKLFIAVAAAFVFTVLVWLLRQMLHTPVKSGRNTSQTVLLRVYGSEPELERNIRGIIWLNENGIFRCSIVICGFGLDEETRFVAHEFEEEYSGITLIEDGEIDQWIRNWNC